MKFPWAILNFKDGLLKLGRYSHQDTTNLIYKFKVDFIIGEQLFES